MKYETLLAIFHIIIIITIIIMVVLLALAHLDPTPASLIVLNSSQ